MKVLGLTFVGTRTDRADEMTRFATDVLGLVPRRVADSDAAFFDLPDGSTLAVQPHDEPERTVGLLVDDVDAAVVELHAAGVETDEVQELDGVRYVHLRAPDGALYELVSSAGTTPR